MRHLASSSLLAALVAVLLVPLGVAGTTSVAHAASVPALVAQSGTADPAARLGGRGFGSRRSSPGYRRGNRTSPYARRPYRGGAGRRLFRGILQGLGLAFLFSALFGWGAGGSPFGLILLGAIVLWMIARSRRRRAMDRGPAYGGRW